MTHNIFFISNVREKTLAGSVWRRRETYRVDFTLHILCRKPGQCLPKRHENTEKERERGRDRRRAGKIL